MHRWMARVMGLVFVAASTGCAVTFAKRSPWDIQQLAELSDQMEQFKSLAQLKAQEADELRRAKGLLEQQLGSRDVSIGYDERGLVARLLDRVLFDSGKAVLRRSAHPVLNKVAKVLNDVPDQPVAVEGHTDNVPIQRSGWTDNKALSVARANAVLEYLVGSAGVDADRIRAVGYGEERPIASNDTAQGRQQNRRVEIIILPQSGGGSTGSAAKPGGQGESRYSK